jgi:hypothetical protein
MKITDDMLTEEFPPHIKPVYVGVYPASMLVETDRFGTCDLEIGFAKWDGQRWCAMRGDVRSANAVPSGKAASQAKSWRGLKEKHHG